MEDDYRKYVLLGLFLFLFIGLFTILVSNCMHRHDYNYDSEYHARENNR